MIAYCDLEICKNNINGVCEGIKFNQCPKNNKQSIYEKPELLRIGDNMNELELDEAKINLYRLLLEKDKNKLTKIEIEIMYNLSNSEAIQKRLTDNFGK